MSGEEKLIKLYETAMKELYREIAYKEGRGNRAAYQRKLLDRVKAVLKNLKRQTPGAVRDALESAFMAGIRDFVKDTGFTLEPRINWRQLNILVQNTTNQLTLATNRVGRIWEDAIRRAGIEAAKHKLASGQTVAEMRRQLLAELMNINPRGRDGRQGIITKRGTMRLDTYAALVARSTTAEAQNASKLEMAEQYGYDLVRFTKHSPTCGICAQYEDRVFALTKEAANGKYKGPNGEQLYFPYLYDTAFISGYDNIHPNCRHRIVIVVSSMMTPGELAEWSRKSTRPFVDSRSERDRKAYAKAQSENRARWQDRRQWERYKAVLPDQTPDNFGVFRSMKKADSHGWNDLQEDYRYVAKTEKSGILTEEEEAAVLSYVSGGSYTLNAKLRDGILLEPHEEVFASALDRALKKMPVYRGEVIRSLDFSESELRKFAESHRTGNAVWYPAFTSSSVKSGYHENPSVLMIIDSQTGRDIQAYNREEAEILFPRNSRFLVESVQYENGTWILKARDITDDV